MSKKQLILLCLTLLLAFTLRFYRVTEIPPALNWDEISISYNAYSILKTGKDEWGETFPVHFKAFGEYKLPAQIYASIPGVALLGLNELGVRVTPVFYGTLTVLVIFFLARLIFNNFWIGLISSFLLAISPWHIQLTRASFESSFSVFWIVLGLWWLVRGFRDSKWLILAMFPFALSVYTYNSARVFTPFFLLIIVFLFRRQFVEKFKTAFIAGVMFISLMLPLLPFYLSGEGNARYKLVSISDDPGLVPRIEETRNLSALPNPLPRLLYNRPVYIATRVVGNFLAHFTPDFLFISGASHTHHHVQKMGELYKIQAPLLILGFYWLFKTKNRFRWLFLSWLVLSFIPVSVTRDSIPNALRTLIAVPAYELITAFGLFKLLEKVKEQNIKLVVVGGVIVSVILGIELWGYLNNYYTIYPYQYSRDWQYGNKQVVDFINERGMEYDMIVFSRHYGEPHIFTLFYLKYDPLSYQQSSNLERFETYDWVRVLRFDKYYFPDLNDEGTRFKDIVHSNEGKKLLFIGKPGDFPQEHLKLKKINFLNGDPAFEIVEVK